MAEHGPPEGCGADHPAAEDDVVDDGPALGLDV
jgi:hypothetical protein